MAELRSWMVKSWPQVTCKPPRGFGELPCFMHMGTEIREDRSDSGLRVGDTVWAAALGEQGVVGAAWEWVEVRPGVVMLRDPNALVSNARFIGDEGVALDDLQATTALNIIAHELPWQRVVLDMLRRSEGALAAGPAVLHRPALQRPDLAHAA